MINEKEDTVVVMTLVKSTAGTHVYGEPNVPGKTFPVVYVQKTKLPDPPPQAIEVRIRAVA